MTKPNSSLINPNTNEINEDYIPILESEFENVIKTLKYDKSPGNNHSHSQKKETQQNLQL